MDDVILNLTWDEVNKRFGNDIPMSHKRLIVGTVVERFYFTGELVLPSLFYGEKSNGKSELEPLIRHTFGKYYQS